MSGKNIEWKNERRKIKDLMPWDKNPRKITDEQLEALKKSIEKFNYAAPVVISADGRIVAGHMRTRAMLALGRGEEEVDVRVASRTLTEEEFTELAIRDNANGGDWDLSKMVGFDLDALGAWGFDPDKIDRIRDKVKEDDYDADAKVASIVEPKTKPGQLYVLGEHRLLCGDSTKQADFELLMGGGRARLVFTDPPYNVNYRCPGGLDYKSERFEDGGKILNDDMTDADWVAFAVKVLENFKEFTTDDASLYWWFANAKNISNRQAWEAAGWKMSQVVIWLKNSMVYSAGQDYHRCYEPCMMGWKKGKAHFRNKKISNFVDVFMMDKVDFKELADVWYESRDKMSEYVHPTQKPVRLAERALRKNSVPGDIVLDAFGGSGSTLMACEQMGRRCFAMELDPKYCDTIVERWEIFTGKKAEVM